MLTESNEDVEIGFGQWSSYILGRELLGVGIREIKGIPPELSGGAKLKI